MRARGGFLAVLYAVVGPALVAAFFASNLAPIGIWIGTTWVALIASAWSK
jgi:hypothetical protein